MLNACTYVNYKYKPAVKTVAALPHLQAQHVSNTGYSARGGVRK